MARTELEKLSIIRGALKVTLLRELNRGREHDSSYLEALEECVEYINTLRSPLVKTCQTCGEENDIAAEFCFNCEADDWDPPQYYREEGFE